jgi:hypothetical protein
MRLVLIYVILTASRLDFDFKKQLEYYLRNQFQIYLLNGELQ